MGILDYFKKEKEPTKLDSDNLLSNEELQNSITDILVQVNDLVIKKKENFLERDRYCCSKEQFEIIEEELEKKGFDLDFSVGQYTISRTIKTIKGSTTNILRQFEYNEK